LSCLHPLDYEEADRYWTRSTEDKEDENEEDEDEK
jgi:hypothetical protein